MPSATYGAPARAGGGVTTFLGLSDTPNSFTANKIPQVNAAGDALVWVDLPATAANELPSFAGNGGKILALNAGGTAVEWIDPPAGSVTELPSVTGQSNKILAVKSDASGVEWITAPTGGGASYPSFTGNSGKVLAVNALETGVEWITAAAGGGGTSDLRSLAWSNNMITNGDWETGDTTGWTITTGTPVLATVSGSYHTVNATENGLWILTGGTSASVVMYREFAMTGHEGASFVEFGMSCYKDFTDTDFASLELTMYDASNNVLRRMNVSQSVFTSGAVERLSGLGIIPQGTAKMRVTITLTRTNGTNNNTAVDNVFVLLGTTNYGVINANVYGLGYAQATPPNAAQNWTVQHVPGNTALVAGLDEALGAVVLKKAANTAGSWAWHAVTAGADGAYIFKTSINRPMQSYAAVGIAIRNTVTEKVIVWNSFREFTDTYRQFYNGTAWQGEASMGSAFAQPAAADDMWWKLLRVGNTLTVFCSRNGLLWVQVDQIDLTSTNGINDITDVGIYCQSTATTSPVEIWLTGFDTAQQDEAIGGQGIVADPAIAEPNVQSIAASRNLTLADFDGSGVLISYLGTAATLTIPAGLGARKTLIVMQGAAGQVSIAAGVGVTLRAADNKLATRVAWSMLMIVPIAPDIYVIGGDIA